MKMKVNVDEFENKINSKADQMLMDAFKVKLGCVFRTERFFLLMLSEVLKMM